MFFSKFVRRILAIRPVRYGVQSFSRIAETNLKEAIGKRTKVQGWVYAVRKMKENVFLDVSDGSGPETLQIVVSKNIMPKDLTYGSSVMVEGELGTAPNGRNELRADDISMIGACCLTDGYPFAPRKTYESDYIRQYLHLRPRTRTFSAVLRLRDLTTSAINDHLRSRNFINVHTPILTSNDCEGAGEAFAVQPDSKELLSSMKKEGIPNDESYFDGKAFLTVSGQLHLEAVTRAFTRVYTFGPSFRAENSKSRVHLSEFYMLEAELAFLDDLETLMDEIEHLVKAVSQTVLDKGASDVQLFNGIDPHWITKKFARLTYDEAVHILQTHVDRLQFPINYGSTFSKEHELFLVQHNNGVPVFITNWPKGNKPFYMKECNDDDSKVAALDLLAPTVGEIVGGSLREDDYEKLKAKLPSNSNLSWYLDLRKYGNVPTGGFGLGFERFLQFILGISNIKDTIPFPRWPHNCKL